MYEPIPSSPPVSKGPVDNESSMSDDNGHFHPPRFGASVVRWREVYLAIFICVLCVFINASLSIFPSSRSSSPTFPSRASDIRTLRHPSQYMGLDQVVRPSPPIQRQFNNYPILVAQIDSAHPTKVYPVNVQSYMPNAGTISPDTRRVRVTETISTIVQFRAIDWGMESCEIILQLPLMAEHELGAFISLYRLNATLPLDQTKLSSSSRPPRISKVARIYLSAPAPRWHRRFACRGEEVLSFELACSNIDGGPCNVHWWQESPAGEDAPAIFMTQFATV